MSKITPPTPTKPMPHFREHCILCGSDMVNNKCSGCGKMIFVDPTPTTCDCMCHDSDDPMSYCESLCESCYIPKLKDKNIPTPTTGKEDWRKELSERFVGFNDRGIVYYSDGLAVTGYRTPTAVCRNCGAEAKGEEAKKWQFGHVGCPKPNGEFLRNDFEAKDLKEFIERTLSSQLQQQKERIVKEIEKSRGNDYHNIGMGDLDYHEKNAVDAYITTLKHRLSKSL